MSGVLKQYPHFKEYFGWLNCPRSWMSFQTLTATGLPIACDNSAYSGFDEDRYTRMVNRIGEIPIEWITLPDVVGDAETTSAMFLEWHDRLSPNLPRAYVGQDGSEDLELPWEHFRCFFVGGTTEWKLSGAARDMMKEAQIRKKWVHVGRVNSDKRLRYCFGLNVDSVDGSGYSRWQQRELVPALNLLHGLHNQLTFDL